MNETDKNKLALCVDCDCEVEYVSKDELREVTVKGVCVSFIAKSNYCSKCGAPLFVYEDERINIIRCYDEYKLKKGLLTSSEIIEIRKKYGLSQTDLAKAIKVGKKNIARYESGKIQDASIDLLIRLLDKHPNAFGIKNKK